ncbi:hypothetical protein SPHINGOT1_260307 [Sphingomonas sp. T1]|uniref:phospholipase D family protein n=1 Tax=Sphingomonas sp. T1 TaxID=2653172 RepID=UPI0012F0E19D|nr:phospholipase D family protein [Sphingomonas sp. T1]VXC96463.1 hypothetical protein SPHINGOT1_260307 [Sphingomonas sp. T1]
MKILHGHELATAILDLFREPGRLRCAVAFWGSELGAIARKRKVEVVLDISMGGTSRNALKALGLRRKSMPQADGRVTLLDGLHAKIFVGTRYAVIGSANASRRALGRDGLGPSLQEAGVLFDRAEDPDGYGKLEELYEHYRGLSRAILPGDLDRAPRVASNPAARDFQAGPKSTSASVLSALLADFDRFSRTSFIFGDHRIEHWDWVKAKEAYADEVGEPPEAAGRTHICSAKDDPDTDGVLRDTAHVFVYWFGSPLGVSAYHDVVRIEHRDGTVSYFGRLGWTAVRSAHRLPAATKADTWRADSTIAEAIANSDEDKVKERFVALSSGDLFELLESNFAGDL